MAKAILSNKCYLDDPGEEVTKEIVKSLTYKIPKKGIPGKLKVIETIKSYKKLPKGIIAIPVMRQDLIPEGYEIVDKRSLVPVEFPVPKYALYSEQQPVFDEANDSCIINALPGWGKSYTALYIAAKFSQKTLIITHTIALRDQWVEGVKDLYGIECGIIGGGKLDYEDHIITVANIQTLKKHAEVLAKTFGTVITDEMHHSPATTFTDTLSKLHCRYRVGLSGTLIRKDNKHVLFKDYFGKHVIQPPQANTLNPTVKIVKTGIMLKPDVPWVDKMTDLINNKVYQNLVAKIAIGYIAEGHKVLIISDRVDFLITMGELIGDDCMVVTGNIGDRNEAKELINDGVIFCIAGSRQLFSEGISVNCLSCVILGNPINNDSLLEQIAGRVQRKHPGKLDPLLIDMQFSDGASYRQNTARIGLYMRKGWEYKIYT